MCDSDQESSKDIIVNWLKSPYEEVFVSQEDEGDCVMRDISTRDQNRKLTEKGKEYMKH